MSSFNCDKCGAPCLDSPNGYTTGCEHYPPDIKQVPKIKPLVWDSAEALGMKLLRASNPMVQFEMFATSKNCKVLMFGRNYKKKKDFDTEAEAKAWCQAEYERRVRECLE